MNDLVLKAKQALDEIGIPATGANVGGYRVCKYDRGAFCVSTIIMAQAGDKTYIALCRKPVDFNTPQGELRPYEIPGGHLIQRALPGAANMDAPYDKTFHEAGLRKVEHETSLQIAPENCTTLETYYWSGADLSGVTDISVYHAGKFDTVEDLPKLNSKDNELAVVEWIATDDMKVDHTIPNIVVPHTAEPFGQLQKATNRYTVQKPDGRAVGIIDAYGAILDRCMTKWRHIQLERDFGVMSAIITSKIQDPESGLGQKSAATYQDQRQVGQKYKDLILQA